MCLSDNSYHQARTYGFDEAQDLLQEDEWDDLYELDDQAFPEAFSYALRELPEDAALLSEAVHDGIQAAYERYWTRQASDYNVLDYMVKD